MAQKTRGMAENPFARRANGDAAAPRPSSGLVTALRASGAQEPQTARLDDMAPNPDNPASRVDPASLDGLVESIRQIGFVQPFALVSAAAFLRQRPQHADAVGERSWVILGGHRRQAAGLLAGKEEAPILVRDDLLDADRGDEVLIHENLHRLTLTPLEEAAGFARIMERQGLSQRKLAEHLGVGQGQISKRLTLLALPEVLHPDIESGELQIKDALEIAEQLRDEEVRSVFDEIQAEARPTAYSWGRVVEEAATEVGRRQRVAAAMAVAEEEGLEYVDAMEKWGERRYSRELTTKAAVAEARKAGTLVVSHSPYRYDPAVKYYTTASSTKKKGADADTPEKIAERERKAAAKARMTFLGEVVKSKTFVKDAEVWRTHALLTGLGLGSNTTTAARKLCAAAEIGPHEVTEDYPWRDSLVGHRDELLLASVIAVAALEVHTSEWYHRWTPTTKAYLDWLCARGYVLSEQETKELATIASAVTEEGDSVESVDEPASDSVESGPTENEEEGL